MKVVVIGGTGLIGSKVVQILQAARHEAIAAAPSTGVNSATGEGLAEALAGCDVVVDMANSPSFDDDVAMRFFRDAGHNIMAAEIAAGVSHHVGLSVVGTNQMQGSGYFRAKLAQERAIESSPIPYTLVHATQFFEFVRSIAQFSTIGDAVRLPPVLFRPIAAEDVAAVVAQAALADPLNGIVEIAGPDMFTLDEAIRRTLALDRDPRPVIADAEAPYFGVHVDLNTLVPGEGAHLGTTHFDWWLTNTPNPAAS